MELEDWQGALLTLSCAIGFPLIIYFFGSTLPKFIDFIKEKKQNYIRFSKEKTILTNIVTLDAYKDFNKELLDYINLVEQSYLNIYNYAKNDHFKGGKSIELVSNREFDLYAKIIQKSIELDNIIDGVPTLSYDWFKLSMLYDTFEEAITVGFIRPKDFNRYSFGHYLDVFVKYKESFDLQSAEIREKLTNEITKLENA